MTDVTRWDDHGYAAGLVPKPNGEFVKYADHLAALERVRVETLREARASAWSEMPTGCQLAAISSCPNCQEPKAIARFLDRLINAATTGDTDD